jgi:adenylate cyclase
VPATYSPGEVFGSFELEPGLPDAYYVEMIVRRLEGDPEKILQAIEKVLETNPDDGQAREWAAWGYMVLGRPEEALPILEKLTEHYMALTWLSACYTMLGRQEEADRILRERLVETVRRNPEMSHVRSLLGIALVRSGDTETGIAQSERALALSPEDGRMSYNLACAYALAGQPERAIEQIKKAIADLPTYLSDWPREDPDLVSLHDHPEFKRIFP